ncbi:hypothetical protein HUG20_02990 [Salicibibacter cibi]|uniref:Toxin-antitoxin system, antitoxin component, Xre family protein n=1 Tax=Salicibibacter cibi TaxID=2743001 RepID=A0A7T6Z939_9BACI|nr:hypothetical protein [Salicibibacter cibi]QQK78972.1 hypothetical protein HUG20_02990 [Salicibibacter cibi]
MAMSEKETLIQLLNTLDDKQISALKTVVESMALKELEQKDIYDALKVSEPSFKEWDNQEDDEYNDL